jgi:hypothetical protein
MERFVKSEIKDYSLGAIRGIPSRKGCIPELLKYLTAKI